MKIDDITAAINEAERFIERAAHLRSILIADNAQVTAKTEAGDMYAFSQSFPKQSGAARRASMDLTRSLAKMRGAK